MSWLRPGAIWLKRIAALLLIRVTAHKT